MTRPEVVVTGLGATTPLGGDVASTWDGLVNGRSGIRALEDAWAAQLPVRVAGIGEDGVLGAPGKRAAVGPVPADHRFLTGHRVAVPQPDREPDQPN